MVAFEKVSIQGIEIIAHADINDLDQTLYTPRILTTASEKDTGAKEMEASGTKELTDHVLYECLPEGDYVMQGILMDKASGKPIMDADGKEITSSQTFKADANGGYVDMNFTVHADELSGKTVVVFEKVYQADENGEPVGDSLANHEDLNDISQAVTFPSIATELIDEQTGNHRALAAKKVKHIDIDYAIRKDASEVPPRYIVFFKAKDADAMTAAFKEYSAKVLKKQQTRKSVLAELHKAVAIAASLPQKAVDHVKNLHQDLSL
jgi:hypothetical protein